MRQILGLSLAILAKTSLAFKTSSPWGSLVENDTTPLTQANCDENNKYHVKELPGFKKGYTWPCSYAGQVSSSKDNASHKLFFWMYPTASTDENAPAIIWLNGGPGASSMLANFLFSGPLRIDQDKDTGAYDMYTVSETWMNIGTVIYIDQPVGTGFATGDPLLTNMTDVTAEFVYFMKQMRTEFP